MKEIGKVVFLDNLREGENKRTGEHWQSLDFVIETDERFPRKVKFNLFGAEKIAKASLEIGKVVEVEAWAEAREYEGKWYNELKVAKILVNSQNILL